RKRYLRRNSSLGGFVVPGSKGTTRLLLRTSSFAARMSISPVGSFGLTSLAARRTTAPVTRSTSSFRTEPDRSCSSAPCDGSKTTCTLPYRSRRSTKTRPPWARRLSTQPQTVTVLSTLSARNSPHVCVRNKGTPFAKELHGSPRCRRTGEYRELRIEDRRCLPE